jgi:hypothetical protein
MVDWEAHEQLVNQKLGEARNRSGQPQYRPPPRRAGNPFAWLSRLFPRRKPAAKPEEAPPRPAFR